MHTFQNEQARNRNIIDNSAMDIINFYYDKPFEMAATKHLNTQIKQ